MLIKDEIIGTWKLVVIQTESSYGNVSYLYWKKTMGRRT